MNILNALAENKTLVSILGLMFIFLIGCPFLMYERGNDSFENEFIKIKYRYSRNQGGFLDAPTTKDYRITNKISGKTRDFQEIDPIGHLNTVFLIDSFHQSKGDTFHLLRILGGGLSFHIKFDNLEKIKETIHSLPYTGMHITEIQNDTFVTTTQIEIE